MYYETNKYSEQHLPLGNIHYVKPNWLFQISYHIVHFLDHI